MSKAPQIWQDTNTWGAEKKIQYNHYKEVESGRY